jgi:hypothetical protein
MLLMRYYCSIFADSFIAITILRHYIFFADISFIAIRHYFHITLILSIFRRWLFSLPFRPDIFTPFCRHAISSCLISAALLIISIDADFHYFYLPFHFLIILVAAYAD